MKIKTFADIKRLPVGTEIILTDTQINSVSSRSHLNEIRTISAVQTNGFYLLDSKEQKRFLELSKAIFYTIHSDWLGFDCHDLELVTFYGTYMDYIKRIAESGDQVIN